MSNAMVRWARLCAYLTILCALITPGRTAASAQSVLEIPAVLSLTGIFAISGVQQERTLEGLESLLNKDGGVKGHQFKFVFYDDGGSPQTAVQIVESVLLKKPVALIGPSSNAGCRAVLPLVGEHGPVTYCLSGSDLIVPKGSFLFTSGFSMQDQLARILQYAKQKNLTHIATLTEGPSSIAAVETLLDAQQSKGITIVDSQRFSPDTTDLSAQMAHIKAASPQAIILSATGMPLLTALRSADEIGFNIPIFTPPAPGQFLNQYRSIIPKQLFVAGSTGILPPSSSNPVLARYRALLQTQHLTPDPAVAATFDAASLLMSALEHVGLDGSQQQLRDYILNLRDFPGVSGVYNFRSVPQRGLDYGSVVVLRWDQAKASFDQVDTCPPPTYPTTCP